MFGINLGGCLCASLAIVVMLPVGCQESPRYDNLVQSVPNASHTYRATIIRRRFIDRGVIVDSDVTFVLVHKDAGVPQFVNGQDFDDGIVVMSPDQMGPLKLVWMNDHSLKVLCDDCHAALDVLGTHATTLGDIQISYEGFPKKYQELPLD